MNDHPPEQSQLAHRLSAVKQQLQSQPLNEDALGGIAAELLSFAEDAQHCDREQLFRGAELLSRVTELAASWNATDPDQANQRNQLLAFVEQHVNVLDHAVSDTTVDQEIASFIHFAHDNWRDYLALFDAADAESPWSDTVDEDDSAEADLSPDQIQLMLAALGNGSNAEPSQPPEQLAQPPADPHQDPSDEEADVIDAAGGFMPTPADQSDAKAREELANDRELLEAYLDDALRCLSSMEQAAMTIEQQPGDRDTARQFCRELHTLKGASATVGLASLASHLHQLESSLEQTFQLNSDKIDAEPLFAAVDRVRGMIDSLQPGQPAEQPQPSSTPTPEARENLPSNTAMPPIPVAPQRPATPRARPDFQQFASADDASVRIRASKLDRLMDMLAELVVLRNRRESHVNEFNELNEELTRCAARVSFADEQFDSMEHGFVNVAELQRSTSTMSEVSKDIAAVSQGLRELQKPVVNDNGAISRFIRDFRHELMQLRRIPMSGLFNRLQRAARDAAKSESKKVQVIVHGEHAGLEQEIQERLFDPLLHIVRNSVSHGIEASDVRTRSGKDEVGTIELNVTSNAQLLTIEVRDDGGGIDYQAVRQRALEKGLLHANDRPTQDQLAKLIFHPGFSTRDTTSEISGRGVGMDVVANTIEQLHGRIEIDSEPGTGTTMRLLIPLRTGIEHVMVFRSGGQLFALPMQSVTAAKGQQSQPDDGLSRVTLASVLSLPSEREQTGPQDVLVLRRSGTHWGRRRPDADRLALAVDALVGPEEVVVRKLPALLRNHRLFTGITLSGSGEKVLLLDADRVVEFCSDQQFDSMAHAAVEPADAQASHFRALVVDDSLTARKMLVKFLKQQGLSVTEAGDGIEAVEKLHRESFDVVFTDLDMPRMGGMELLADMQTGNYCEAPRVVVSSRNDSTFRDQTLELGAADFVNKPVSETKITQLLERFELLPENVKGSIQ